MWYGMTRGVKGDNMAERKVTVAVPPTGEPKEGVEVQIEESTERWSEFKFEDGTVIRAKLTIMSAVRVEGEYDPLETRCM